eukprot:267756-Chlamydomonas_euryale.AAC.1
MGSFPLKGVQETVRLGRPEEGRRGLLIGGVRGHKGVEADFEQEPPPGFRVLGNPCAGAQERKWRAKAQSSNVVGHVGVLGPSAPFWSVAAVAAVLGCRIPGLLLVEDCPCQ